MVGTRQLMVSWVARTYGVVCSKPNAFWIRKSGSSVVTSSALCCQIRCDWRVEEGSRNVRVRFRVARYVVIDLLRFQSPEVKTKAMAYTASLYIACLWLLANVRDHGGNHGRS
jgi:hypothetical protein